MKKAIKIFLLLVTVVTLMLTATSCFGLNFSSGGGNGVTENGGGNEENKNEGVKITVVVSDDVNTSFFSDFKSKIETKYNAVVSLTGKESII